MKKQKILAYCAIVVILAVTAIVLVSSLRKSREIINENQGSGRFEIKATNESQGNESEVQSSEINTINAEGIVEKLSVENRQLTLKNESSILELTLAKDLLIYAQVDGKSQKLEASELKKGDRVKVEIKADNSEVIAIQIIK
jgi:hypothetical protein